MELGACACGPRSRRAPAWSRAPQRRWFVCESISRGAFRPRRLSWSKGGVRRVL